MGDEKDPTQTTEQGDEIPEPARDDLDRPPRKAVRPQRSTDDVPEEMVDAARQESEYPGDETDEG